MAGYSDLSHLPNLNNWSAPPHKQAATSERPKTEEGKGKQASIDLELFPEIKRMESIMERWESMTKSEAERKPTESLPLSEQL